MHAHVLACAARHVGGGGSAMKKDLGLPEQPAVPRVVTAEPLAHVAEDGRAHLLREHLEAVGQWAAMLAPREDLRAPALVTGRWHDLGKYTRDFQIRIRKENGFEAHLEKEGALERDHSTAGALWSLSRDRHLMPLAFAIAGHHSGLPDASNLRNRVGRTEKQALLSDARARCDAPALLDGPLGFSPEALDKLEPRQVELWTRMLFSVLCDADFLDTEAFFDANRSAAREVPVSLSQLAERLRGFLREKQRRAPDTEVNRVRREVLTAAVEAAVQRPGVFSLTVPTGGGKTLTSMAFALEHARTQGLQRVIVAIPYTSIIEQSAEAYRQAFQGLEHAVIEHHSAVDPDRETPLNRVASENWDAPIIVTTTVQLLESLFARRPSACRKLHRVARSVIVLDEAQTLPASLLEPILDGLGALVRDYGCSVVICTATQPALGRRPDFQEGLPEVREIVPASVRAFERLRRVRVRWPSSGRKLPYAELADAVAAERDVLAVVHLRADARRLCELVDERLGHEETLHLSALMCPEHRSQVLADIKARKRRREPVRLVATQLVEAGVDLDFGVVYRGLGGLDALAQAAGRCNREGLMEGLGELRVYEPETQPPRGVPRAAQDVTRGLLEQSPDLDLFAPESFQRYFARLYATRHRDEKGIQALRAKFQFEEVSKAFKLVEDDWSASVVVPYVGHAPLVNALRERGPSRERLRALQRFTVTVPRKLRDDWLARELARLAAETVAYLGPEHTSAYHKRFGLLPDHVGIFDPSFLIPA
ncbi:CRISPR-associated helicase Cas3 [Myxococcus xanthus DK 1622]|uniref:CRISPR-associated helicase Cas3 n=2 Tax=Myxococcaceae TaxID=31 RepID=Q1CWU0_MYXXD|nr:CRISPR-associated helicase Cas3 [Myxococcus xanthus DK 1622]NOJ52814.1 CRISPR-associated endonuclease Cas3'' [Myxococcus xanthus]QPM79298.1 CRISPR-associated endonuclease Cas3'' [Myxococcus xanthus]QVW68377.1 CRISPR-associated endonuclease Cas3'' [Myxococcus xanthus DZ2]UEO05509.1 CRISPR-associated endonuclease Cas3'' [Myxococcus xanthus DZ2]